MTTFRPQITSGPAQQTQPEAAATNTHEQAPGSGATQQPRKGSQVDHRSIYSPKRPARGWGSGARPTKAGSNEKHPAGMDTGLASAASKAEQHIAAQGLPPHVELLDKRDRQTYTDLWAQLPGIPAHWRTRALSQEERENAIANIETRQGLDDKAAGILKSRPLAIKTRDAGHAADPAPKHIAQSKADLKATWAALQTNRAMFSDPRKKAAGAA
jgi:hypothetical protein